MISRYQKTHYFYSSYSFWHRKLLSVIYKLAFTIHIPYNTRKSAKTWYIRGGIQSRLFSIFFFKKNTKLDTFYQSNKVTLIWGTYFEAF